MLFTLQIQPTTTRLHGASFYEKIDIDTLTALKNTDYAVYENRWGQEYYNEQTTLTDYAANYKKKLGLVQVGYTRGRKNLGRAWPQKSLGMTAIRRITRNTLMRNEYYDIDIDNAHPHILRGILAKNMQENHLIHLDYPQLVNYCDNRNTLIAQVMTAYACDRQRAKDAFIALMYGGSVASWKRGKDGQTAVQGTDPVVESFLEKFGAELRSAETLFIDKNRELFALHSDAYRKDKGKDKHNDRGSFFSIVMQDFEIKIIDHLLTYVMDRTPLTRVDGHADKHILTYSYDGFMLLKERVDASPGGLSALLDTLSQMTYNYCGINVKFSSKDMNQEYHTEFVFQPAPSCSIALQDGASTGTGSFDEAYEEMKLEFEKENFKVIHNSCFVQEVYDEDHNRKLIHRCPAELKVAFAHLVIKYTGYDDKMKPVQKSMPFIPVWMACENIRRYNRMDCFPDASKCPADCFNIWIPFEMERYAAEPLDETAELMAGVAFFRHHLSIMCNHEADTLAEFERWIAQIIQFPDTKSYMPIFQSAEGAGKGSFMQLMKAILGESKVFLTASPEEYVWGRFNNLMETAFLVFFDEISKQMTSGGVDKIKSIVTEPMIQIQHKGKGGYTMKSFHRFSGLTNAWDGGMTVSKGSRRFLMCQMSNEKKGDMEYWAKFYSLIKNRDVLRGFYEYYKKMEVPRDLARPKMTGFALELAKLSVDVPTLWVKDMIADAKINKSHYLGSADHKHTYKSHDGHYIMELMGAEAYRRLMEWCKENGYDKFETTPTKLGVFLTTKKWAGLTKGRSTKYGDTKYYYVDRLSADLADEAE
jgi:hypothetical protein